jgi:hypothetical protein
MKDARNIYEMLLGELFENSLNERPDTAGKMILKRNREIDLENLRWRKLT